jgi:hypothetical protein
MRLLLTSFLLLGVTAPACAETVSPEVGKYLQQAESLIAAQKYPAALQAVQRADAVGHLSPYESMAVAQLRGAAAQGAGQYELAATSYQQVLASGLEPPAQKLPLLQAISGFYAASGNNAQTITWVNRYIAAGGNDAQTRALVAQAYYQEGDAAAAEQAIARDEKALPPGQTLPEAELQLQDAAAQKAGDQSGSFAALQALLIAHPTPQYWDEAISLISASPQFSDDLTLEVERLRFATGTLTVAADYEDYAERALLASQPAEARQVIDAGFSSGVLDAQTDAGHTARLKKLLDGPNPAAASASADKSPLAEAAAAAEAGNKQLAVTQFKSVPGYAQASLATPDAALARLWVIHIQQAPAS